MKKFIFLLAVALLFFSCNKPKDKVANNELVLASLYNYYAAEYEALAYQAYNMASTRIKEIKAQYPERMDLAIVLDIDETALNNSPYQAKLILENISYDSCWNDWCNAGMAKAIPGVLEFLQLADSLQFNIFYVTNRKDKFVKSGTIRNMKALDFPQCTEDHFLLRTEGNSKSSRREFIEKENEIVLLVGDNLGDFFEDSKTPGGRSEQVRQNRHEFGRKFIVLPNAMYGNWLDALRLNEDTERLDSLLQNMTGKENWAEIGSNKP